MVIDTFSGLSRIYLVLFWFSHLYFYTMLNMHSIYPLAFTPVSQELSTSNCKHLWLWIRYFSNCLIPLCPLTNQVERCMELPSFWIRHQSVINKFYFQNVLVRLITSCLHGKLLKTSPLRGLLLHLPKWDKQQYSHHCFIVHFCGNITKDIYSHFLGGGDRGTIYSFESVTTIWAGITLLSNPGVGPHSLKTTGAAHFPVHSNWFRNSQVI